MRILLIGATGTLGSALRTTLAERGHDVLAVSRKGGDLQCDVTDAAQVSTLYEQVGQVDAVACAAGFTPFKVLRSLTPEDYLTAFRGKVLSQIDLVRQGLSHVGDRGSFALISGVLSREPIVTAAAASMANGAVESFVRACALEIAPHRINAVSPSVFTESLPKYGAFFPGVPSVDVAAVVQAYVRSIEGAQTGQVFVP